VIRRFAEVALGGVIGAAVVLASLSWSPAHQAMVPVAAALPTPPLQTTPVQTIGRQLLECREMRARGICQANPRGGACGEAHAAITGDGVFVALRDMNPDSLFDVVARVDAAMVECAGEMGIAYQRKVW
jgi:hypothetical protein